MTTIRVTMSPRNASVSATKEDFVQADGMLNFTKIMSLAERIDKHIAKSESETPAKPAAVYVMSRKAKPLPYSAAKERAAEPKYTKQRAIKIATRVRMPKPEMMARIKLLFTEYTKDALTPQLFADQKAAVMAIKQHMKKAEGVLGRLAKTMTKIRADEGKVFEESIGILKSLLEKAGIKDANVAIGQSMFGKQMMIKLDADHVVSVGKSDVSRFRAAKRAATETSEE